MKVCFTRMFVLAGERCAADVVRHVQEVAMGVKVPADEEVTRDSWVKKVWSKPLWRACTWTRRC